MFNLLHSFEPQPIMFSLGPLQIHWYGLCLVLAISAGFFVFYKLARAGGLESDLIFDLGFWATLGGLLGARIYEIFLDSDYYFSNPAAMVKVWEGGLAIHGALLGGGLAVYIFLRKHKKSLALGNFKWLALADWMVPAVALGQAVGRFGNYFNQELFGLPTDLPWGIPIAIMSRPSGYESFTYFHPTFLYESLGNLLIFGILLFIWKKRPQLGMLSGIYAIAYGCLRFSLEFIKIDATPMLWGLRWPQIASLILVILGILLLIYSHIHAKTDLADHEKDHGPKR
jgi:phosphatidylglycerol:prolipoprotein diacylglycerol transferase